MLGPLSEVLALLRRVDPGEADLLLEVAVVQQDQCVAVSDSDNNSVMVSAQTGVVTVVAAKTRATNVWRTTRPTC